MTTCSRVNLGSIEDHSLGFVSQYPAAEGKGISTNRRLTSVKHASAHLLVIYVKMPPKFLNRIIPIELDPLDRSPAVAAAPGAVATALPDTEPEERASETMFQVLFPVASAIMLPPFRKPSMLSMRSGTVMKANDPARATMRGNAITKSFEKGPVRDVTLDVAVMLRL